MTKAMMTDTISSLIYAYRSARHYCEAFEGLDDETYDALARTTYLPLREALLNSTEAATTSAGALAALELAREEYQVGKTPMIVRMLDAAMGYFDRIESAETCPVWRARPSASLGRGMGSIEDRRH